MRISEVLIHYSVSPTLSVQCSLLRLVLDTVICTIQCYFIIYHVLGWDLTRVHPVFSGDAKPHKLCCVKVNLPQQKEVPLLLCLPGAEKFPVPGYSRSPDYPPRDQKVLWTSQGSQNLLHYEDPITYSSKSTPVMQNSKRLHVVDGSYLNLTVFGGNNFMAAS